MVESGDVETDASTETADVHKTDAEDGDGDGNGNGDGDGTTTNAEVDEEMMEVLESLQTCVLTWCERLEKGNDAVEELAVALRYGAEILPSSSLSRIHERLLSCVSRLPLHDSLHLSAALLTAKPVSETDTNAIALKVTTVLKSAVGDGDGDGDGDGRVLHSALEALHALRQSAPSSPAVIEATDYCLPLLAPSSLNRLCHPSTASTLHLLADVFTSYPFADIGRERILELSHRLLNGLQHTLSTFAYVCARILSSALSSLAVSYVLLEPKHAEEQREAADVDVKNSQAMLPDSLLELMQERPAISPNTRALNIRAYLLSWYVFLEVFEAVDETKKVKETWR